MSENDIKRNADDHSNAPETEVVKATADDPVESARTKLDGIIYRLEGETGFAADIAGIAKVLRGLIN